MEKNYDEVIREMYEGFNSRDIDLVFSFMRPDVHWPNGWEGGYVHGYSEVRDYWTRQWKEIDPIVIPISIKQLQPNNFEVKVHQTVKDLTGSILFDGIIKHHYIFEDGLIKSMEIEQ